MTKILIPSSLIELKGVVQQCLVLAKDHGFSIEQIELGVSPTQLIHLVPDQNAMVSVSTDLVDEFTGELGSDFTFYYQSKVSLEEVGQRSSAAVFIGVDDASSDNENDDKTVAFYIWRHPRNDEVI